MSNVVFGSVLAGCAALAWAVGAMFARLGLQHVGSRAGTAISGISGFVVALALAFALDPSALVATQLGAGAGFLLVGLLQFPVGRLLHYSGISLAGVTRAMTLSSSAPVFAAAWAVLFLGERMTPLVAVGTLAVVVGMASVVSTASGSRGPIVASVPAAAAVDASTGADARDRRLVALGLGCSVLAGMAYGTVHTLIKYFSEQGVPPEVGAVLTIFSGMATMVLVASGQWRRTLRTHGKGIWWMAAAGVGSSLAIFSVFLALERAPVVLVSPIAGTSPLFVLLFTRRFLGDVEQVPARSVVGTVSTVAGVALVVLGQR